MSKYKFIKLPEEGNPHDVSTVEMTVDTVTYVVLLEEFQHFLKACGFIFKGQVDIVAEEGDLDVD